METAFDFLSFGCFVGLVIAYLKFAKRDFRTLAHLIIPAATFAIANQIGNAGLSIFAFILLVTGAGYAALILKKEP